MAAEIVMALYRPKPGKEAEIEVLVNRHVPLLRAEGLATDRPTIVVRSDDGTLIEVFEWDTSESPVPPHQIPAVKEIWDAMEAVADFAALGDLAEGSTPLPSFAPVDLDYQ